MLAQNFKTPTDLGISHVEFDALVKVLGMLERGEIAETPRHSRFLQFYTVPEDAPAPTMFAMDKAVGTLDCGTAGCFMGWARFVANDQSLFRSSVWSEPSWTGPSLAILALRNLFIPGNKAINCRRPALGAVALRNFLTLGNARWDEVMEEA